ncbi:hypothetical protein LUZ62_050622 [Rhynchospora pubera]|uniref:Tyrosine specific protein phosphatases domain-containing protein n=1 Tax=Rhynchospora pubera TaxID=906938 RepID=A0AAV8G7W7_9POAL|nr:hypothetical protein LUZ62_050622 [Rhynchospora pubera]
MGISALIGLKSTALLCSSYITRKLGLKWFSYPLLYASLISYLVSVASHPSINLPLLLGKSSDGSFPVWSKVIFAPFLIFIRIFVPVRRFKRREPLYTEISDGLYVGGWPTSLEDLPPGEISVIDCTCELPKSRALDGKAYLCVATWDTRAPQPSQIESAVRWASRKRAQKKPIYVHCAFGHGRSVCVMCAILVALGLAEDWKEAEKMIKEKRPFIKMNSLHRKSLEEWSKHLLSNKRSSPSTSANSDVASAILSEYIHKK